MKAALLFNSFSLQSLVRFYLDLNGAAFGVVEGADLDETARIIALSQEALKGGVSAGGTVAQARTRCPELQIVPRQPRLEESAIESLRQIALSFSPRFKVSEANDQVYLELDLRGLESLLGDLEEVAENLLEEVSNNGFKATIGLAPTQKLARLYAACGYFSLKQAPDGFWKTVSISDIDILKGVQARLLRLGVRTVWELLELPSRALSERIGRAALEVCEVIRGSECEVPLPIGDGRDEYKIEYECMGPLCDRGVLVNLLEELANQLMKRIESRGLLCAELAIWLTYEGRGRDDGISVIIKPARPTRDVQLLAMLFALRLKKARPLKNIEKITIKAFETQECRQQLSLFDTDNSGIEGLGSTLLKLQGICGIENVGVPTPSDSWREDSFSLEPFGVWSKRMRVSDQDHRPFFEALRRFRPPISCDVLWDNRVPHYLESKLVNGRVLSFAGPYRRMIEWWISHSKDQMNDGIRLDAYDVYLSNESCYRLTYNWDEGHWWLVGCYD